MLPSVRSAAAALAVAGSGTLAMLIVAFLANVVLTARSRPWGSCDKHVEPVDDLVGYEEASGSR